MAGLEYNSSLSHTFEDRLCLSWSSFNRTKLRDDKNYWRNPDNSLTGPWCYINNNTSQKQFCYVPLCGLSKDQNEIYFKNFEMAFTKTYFWDYHIMIESYVHSICIIFGTIFNGLSVAVFTHPLLLRKYSITFTLLYLSFFHNMVLLIGLFPRWLELVSDWEIINRSNIVFAIYLILYLSSIVTAMSNWTIVIVTLQRLIAILKPHKYKFLYWLYQFPNV